jgi:SAM-dependent methyltransferase
MTIDQPDAMRSPKHRMIEDSLATLIGQAHTLSAMDDAAYSNFCRLWHAANDAVKDAIYAQDFNSLRFTREHFERDWGAQSTLFMADMLPFIHEKLLRHYRRQDVLRAIDVGAASCFGTRLLATLHGSHFVYSRMQLDALDYVPDRSRWVRAVVPEVNYMVQDLYELPSRSWDIVVCSHVVEHVPEPRRFIEKTCDISKGFAFIYSPYNEDPRIPGHLNTITESDYAGLPSELHVIKSMGWHPDRPDDMCLLAIVDCR